MPKAVIQINATGFNFKLHGRNFRTRLLLSSWFTDLLVSALPCSICVGKFANLDICAMFTGQWFGWC